MLDRVDVLTASVGAGHVRAAEAVDSALRRSGACRSVRTIDVLEHCDAPFRALYRDGYVCLVRLAPTLVGWIFRRTDDVRPSRSRSVVQGLALRRLTRAIVEDPPDLVISTHFLPGEVIAGLRASGRLRRPSITVVTDIEAHAVWHARPCDAWCLAAERTRAMLLEAGLDPDALHVTGIPISTSFDASANGAVDRDAARTALGLDAGRPVLLLAAGGLGLGPMEAAATHLLESDVQLLVVCGRNDRLRRRLERLATERSVNAARLRIIAFSERMNELMTAADLLVGKPGGLTTSEAMASGLPMVIIDAIPGQEEANAEFLLRAGAAIRCDRVADLAGRVRDLLDDPERLPAMRRSALRHARPDAANRIAGRAVELARRARTERGVDGERVTAAPCGA